MTEIASFMGFIFLYLFVFFGLQLLIFRTRQIKELIAVFSLIAFGAAFITWIPFYFLMESIFTDPLTRGLLAFAGAYGSLGFSGTYIILGPISADRSLSAHICILTKNRGGRMPEAELLKLYDQERVFLKRYREYVDVGVMEREGDTLILTSKGRRVAYIFETFINALKMKKNY